MANCHICERLTICHRASPQEIICSSFKPKPITNAGRIRSMTDMELAHTLWLTAKGGIIGQRSEDEWLDWLRRETTKGGD